MTVYDLAMVAVLVLGMIRGAWRGFTWQVASIASLVLGYVAARTGSASLAVKMPGEPEVQRVLAMGLIYMVVSGGIFGVAWLVRGTLKKMKFEAYDRHLGSLLGGLEGIGVGLLATLMVVSMAPATRGPIFASPTGHVVGAIMDGVGPILPEEVRDVLKPIWTRGDDASGDVAVAGQGEGPQAAAPVAGPAPALAADPSPSAAPAVAVASATPDSKPCPSPAAEPGPADLPALEEIPDPAPAAPRAAMPSQAARGPAGKPASVRDAARESARQAASGLKEMANQARQEIEQTVAETIDVDPSSAQKAPTLDQVLAKDRQRIEQTVQNVKGARQKVDALARQRAGQVKQQAGQVKQQAKQQAGQVRQQLNQAILSTIDKGQEKLEQAVGQAIDDQLQVLGGLEPAPASTPAPAKAPR
ncbi:Colicin V production protein [Aquisphaera giovannonii]|uniref:Colicin V production protein n=1 Tax=Aquisphaera giovannonii TaxID=406548 RepID=A0A5B9WC90_9BACT|nr:CvpA family protein [Aquisphaera giovannonii]QEH38103.1 Colicin V production protein [Aquisphaera giovannonii]